MSFRKKVDAQQAHILSLRIILGFLTALCLWLAIALWTAPNRLTVHVPPDLRSGSTRLWWDIPPENVYSFGYYIFQQMNRWPKNGEIDYEGNIHRLGSYLTPSCKVYLQEDFALRRNSGELRGRERGVFEIPGRGVDDPNEQRVIVESINAWTINLDIVAEEFYGGEKVKRALARYPLHVVRSDIDPERNPFGLLWDCYSSNPVRIEAEVDTPPGGK